MSHVSVLVSVCKDQYTYHAENSLNGNIVYHARSAQSTQGDNHVPRRYCETPSHFQFLQLHQSHLGCPFRSSSASMEDTGGVDYSFYHLSCGSVNVCAAFAFPGHGGALHTPAFLAMKNSNRQKRISCLSQADHLWSRDASASSIS